MVKLDDIKEVYFIGIGGIGMSALARYFKSRGVKVSGYDKTESPLTLQLIAEGINVHYNDEEGMVSPHADVIVYTPAIPVTHKGLQWCKQNNTALLKRSEVLGIITKSSFNICVAGTHGKTTVSTMVAHILTHSGFGCTAFLGGIASNYNSNFWSTGNNACVIEADEYDRSFLKLFPDMAIITAVDADHLDIYGSEEAVKDSFAAFAKQVKPNGVLGVKHGVEGVTANDKVEQFTYHFKNKDASVFAEHIKTEKGGYVFDVSVGGKVIKNVRLNMGGLHNIENMVAAISIAVKLEIDEEKIRAAVADFRGVKRRFEFIVPFQNEGKTIYIDDYAHHPEELKALLTGVRSLFPDRKCTIIFQPHLYSRTRDFADGFAESLSLADRTILLPVYPARELPIAGVDSNMILQKMHNDAAVVMEKQEVLDWLQQNKNNHDIVITAGAGDIDRLIEPIKNILTGK